jgi:predicted SAM-dependent methyltransferase
VIAALRARVKSTIPFPLLVALRAVMVELQIQRRHRHGVRKARKLSAHGLLKLNLGCGQNLKAGWVNVDLFDPGADLQLDLRQPLPFSDGSASIIYTEHVFEHLALPCTHDAMGWTLEGPGCPSEAMQFLRETLRVLAPGGTFSVGVPDAERAIRMYSRGELERWTPPWCDTPMHFLNYVFRQGREHKYAWDAETLGKTLAAVGFDDVWRRPFDAAIDSEHRRNDTLYFEARTPAGTAALELPIAVAL